MREIRMIPKQEGTGHSDDFVDKFDRVHEKLEPYLLGFTFLFGAGGIAFVVFLKWSGVQ